jgi:hypothetical protein
MQKAGFVVFVLWFLTGQWLLKISANKNKSGRVFVSRCKTAISISGYSMPFGLCRPPPARNTEAQFIVSDRGDKAN